MLANIALIALGLGLIAAASPNPVATAGYAYDQVEQLTDGSTTPAPGHFAEHYAKVLAASQKAYATPAPGASAIPVLGSVMARLTAGSVSHVSILGPMTRIDNIAADQAYIIDGNAQQVTMLDLNAKTYHTIDLKKHADLLKSSNSPKATVDPLPGRTLEGVSTKSFRIVSRSSVHLGCGALKMDVRRRAVMTVFVDPTRVEPEIPPLAALMAVDVADMLRQAIGPAMKDMQAALGTGSGCPPGGGASAESDRLPTLGFVLYAYTALTSDSVFSGGSSVSRSGALIERGNFTALTSDGAPFVIPPDFKPDFAPTPAPTSSTSATPSAAASATP